LLIFKEDIIPIVDKWNTFILDMIKSHSNKQNCMG